LPPLCEDKERKRSVEMEDEVFHLVTTSGNTFKVLIEVIYGNFIDAEFIVCDHGIFIKNENKDKTCSFSCNLKRDSFLTYNLRNNFTFNINIKALRDIFKSVKKNTSSVSMIISEDPIVQEKGKLKIEVESNESGEMVTDGNIVDITITKEEVGESLEESYTEYAQMYMNSYKPHYNHACVIKSKEFSKAKRIKEKQTPIDLTIQGSFFLLEAGVPGVMTVYYKTGQRENGNQEFKKKYCHSLFSSIMKLPSLDKHVKIHQPLENGFPIMFSSDIPSSGSITITIQGNLE
jgi:hypothetical protein